MEFVGRARLWPGEGFAAPPGLGRLASRATIESSARPLEWRRVATRRLATSCGELTVRIGAGSDPEAPAVALVHGVIVSSRYLVPLAAELAGQFAVVAPDLPGYGLSERPASDRGPPPCSCGACSTTDRGAPVAGAPARARDPRRPRPGRAAAVGARRGGAPPPRASRVIPGYAHMPHWSGALEAARVVRRFLLEPLAGNRAGVPADPRGIPSGMTAEHRAEIVRLVKGAPAMGIEALAERTGLEFERAQQLVGEMIADGTLTREDDRLVVVEPAASQTDEPIP